MDRPPPSPERSVSTEGTSRYSSVSDHSVERRDATCHRNRFVKEEKSSPTPSSINVSSTDTPAAQVPVGGPGELSAEAIDTSAPPESPVILAVDSYARTSIMVTLRQDRPPSIEVPHLEDSLVFRERSLQVINDLLAGTYVCIDVADRHHSHCVERHPSRIVSDRVDRDQAPLRESTAQRSTDDDGTNVNNLRRKLRSARTTTELELRNVEIALDNYLMAADNLDPTTPSIDEILQKVSVISETAQELINGAQAALTTFARLIEDLQDDETPYASDTKAITANLAPLPIPKFSGRIWEWENFWNAFNHSMHSPTTKYRARLILS
ncbi:hypothetical protein GCK32_000625 [Trichostrongylus colubriformis]|uniref:Uncharacterized protein n=1 Tax=Trichostrongylus colubriformis TaxID=6319 RepID=A0AAN8G8Y3_TRICO